MHKAMKKVNRGTIMLVAGALVLGGALAGLVQAASSIYSFTARGTITSVDESNKTIKVSVEKAEGKGKEDLEGSSRELKVGTAKVFKSVNGKDKRGTYHNLAIGQEIGFKGVANTDDTFTLSFIRIHERAFSVIGLLQEHDQSAKTLKISVISSTYKPATYKKGTEITMSYTDDSTFKAYKAGEISFGDVNADAQRVKVTGTINNSSDWKVTNLWNNYKATK